MPEPEENKEELETDETDQDGDQESTDFESINPDDLPAEVRPVYDKMMASYTQARQGLSEYEQEVGALQQDSETLEYLLSNPDIRKIAMGMSGEGNGAKQVEVKQPDPALAQTDPALYLTQMVESVVSKQLSGAIGDLKNTLTPLISDRNQQIARTEWANVIAKYPSAQDINVDLINRKLADNPNLSLEEAAILVKPDITIRQSRGGKPAPKVDIGTRRSSTQKEELSAMSRSAQLRAKAEENAKKGATIQTIIRNAFNKIGGGK